MGPHWIMVVWFLWKAMENEKWQTLIGLICSNLVPHPLCKLFSQKTLELAWELRKQQDTEKVKKKTAKRSIIYKSRSLWLLITKLQVSAECSLHLCHPCSLHICDQHLKRATHSQVWAGHSRSFSLQARWHLFTGHPKLFDITPDWVPDKVNVTFLLLFVVVVDNNT